MGYAFTFRAAVSASCRTQAEAPPAPAFSAADIISPFSEGVTRRTRVSSLTVPFGFFGRPRPATADNMCQRKRSVKGLASPIIVATISCMDTIKTALTVTVIILTGCSGAAFSAGTEFANDAGSGGDVATKLDGNDAGTQVVATDADAGETDAAPETTLADAATDAPVSACTCGDAGSSCFYSVSKPPSGYGPPYPVTTVVLTPSAPTATFTASVTAVPMPYQNLAWYDLDLSTFVNGGTIYIQGQVGDGDSTVSSVLMAQCEEPSSTGNFTYLQGYGMMVGNWTFPSQQFPAGTAVLHFGTEGTQSSPTGSTNTNKVTVMVQPAP